MKRLAATITAALALAACSTDTTDPVAEPAVSVVETAPTAPPATEAPPTEPPVTEAPVVEYPPFDQVEPRYSVFFIELEGTTLAQDQGEERLYNLGLGVCRNLDRGNTIDTELAGLVGDAQLTEGDAGSLVGAAIGDMCPHHGQLVEDYIAAND